MSPYAGLGRLLRLAWRRDRLLIVLSGLGLIVLAAGSAQATFALYPDPAQAEGELAAVFDNPATVALYGPLASHSLDALANFKTLFMGAVLLALLAHAIVRRHTRAEEEDGRAELLGAGAVGRRAPLTAAMALSAAAVLVISSLAAISLIAVGCQATGSWALAVGWVGVGLTFTALTGVAAQLASTSRGVAGLTLGTLAVTFLVRMVADTAPAPWLHWLSPFGWITEIAPFGANRFWVLAVALAVSAALAAAAYRLQSERDLGAGILPARRGPATGSLHSVADLVARTARPSVLGWLITMVVLGAVVGSLVGAVGQMVSDPKVAEMLEALAGGAGSIEDIFLRTELLFASAAVTAAALAVLGRLSAEERSGRSELLLSRPVPRLRWFLAHVALAVGLAIGLLLILGLVIGASSARSLGVSIADQVPRLAGAALAMSPAVLTVIGAGALLHGLSARWGTAAWAVLAVGFLLGEIGPTMNLPQWLVNLSPFAHLSQLPGGALAGTSAVVLLALGAGGVIAGGAAYVRRDLA